MYIARVPLSLRVSRYALRPPLCGGTAPGRTCSSLFLSVVFHFSQVDLHIGPARSHDGLVRMKRDLRHRARVPRQLVQQRGGLHVPNIHHPIGRTDRDPFAVRRPVALEQPLFEVVLAWNVKDVRGSESNCEQDSG